MAIRLLSALGLLGATLYPVRAFLLAPTASWAAKAAWLAVLMLGIMRPAAGGLALLWSVPLLPILPYTWPEVPHGIVHLLVLSQALPLLWRVMTGRERLASDAVTWVMVVFLAVSIASVAASYAAYRLVFPSWLAFARELHGHLSRYVFWDLSPDAENMLVALSTLADGLLAFLVLRSAMRWRLPSLYVRDLAWVAVVVALLGGLQAMTGLGLRPMWAIYDPGILRINGTYSDPNALASFFALAFPIACSVFMTSFQQPGRLKPVGWLLGLLAMIASLIMTAGRMGYFATAIGATVLGVRAWRLNLLSQGTPKMLRPRTRRLAISGAAAALAIVLLLMTIGTFRDVRHRDQASYLHTLLHTLNLRQPLDEKLKGRLAIWRTAMLMIRDSPVFGVGLGTMFREFASYNRPVGGFEQSARLSAHNTFLNVAAELGATGLLAWLLLLWVILLAAFRPPVGEERRSTIWLHLGLSSGLVAFIVTMVTGDRTILREDVVMFWIVVALTVAHIVPSYGHPPSGPWIRRCSLAALLLLVVTWPLSVDAEARRVKLERIAWGFHAVEVDSDGRAFRWTTERATFHIPASARAVTVSMRSVAPFPQRVVLLLDGAPADELSFIDHVWHVSRYVLPPEPRSRYRRIELRVTPTWQPHFDQRVLGVMVGEHVVEPSASTIDK